MHPDSLLLMDTCLTDALTAVKIPLNPRLLDVGSRDINGTYRPLIEQEFGWQYTGLDIEAGPNVDIVALPYTYPFRDNEYDIVICGNMLQCTQAFWLVIDEMHRVLKPGGLIVVIAPNPSKYPVASVKYPVDCWRFLEDGIQYLLGDFLGDMNTVKTTSLRMDICGSAFRDV